MRQTFLTFRYTIIAGLLTLALFLAPFDFISNAKSSAEQEAAEIASSLDENQNRVLDDSEILNAIQLWILGDSVAGDDNVINDASILSLVQLWITGESISSPLLMGDDDGGLAETPAGGKKFYWSTFADDLSGQILTCVIDTCGGTTTVVLSLPNTVFLNLIAKDTKLYWIVNFTGIIQSCDIADCKNTIADILKLEGYKFTAPGLQGAQFTIKDTYLYVSILGSGMHYCRLTNCKATILRIGMPFFERLQTSFFLGS